MNSGDWTFGKCIDDIWCNENFSTKEEAIIAGRHFANEEGWFNLYVGQVEEIPVVSPIDADSVIEKVAEKIDEDYGGDCEPGERFLDNLNCGDTERLQELLDEAFHKWTVERDVKCPCFTIENIEEIMLNTDKEREQRG